MPSFFERAAACLGLLVLSPLLAAIAAAVLAADGCPVLFRQWRVGLYGRPFQLLKFRSMAGDGAGPLVTAAADPRITPVGRVLRKYKLDELPQLWNVVRGEMRLIGPRPEVPDMVEPESPAWQAVLSVAPGITDLATLLYRNEEQLLAGARDPERIYREVILPSKLRLNLHYLARRNARDDLKLLAATLVSSALPGLIDVQRLRQIFAVPESLC